MLKICKIWVLHRQLNFHPYLVELSFITCCHLLPCRIVIYYGRFQDSQVEILSHLEDNHYHIDLPFSLFITFHHIQIANYGKVKISVIIERMVMNEDDTDDGEMKQLQSVSNLENPFNQGFHLAQALPTCTKQETRHVQQTYNNKLK